jgi:cytidyltransferase-like protein
MPKADKESKRFVMGAFDDIRTKDIRFLQEAKGDDNLFVRLLTDQAIERITGKPPKFKLEERRYYLKSIRYATDVSSTDQTLPILPTEYYQGGTVPLWIISKKQAEGVVGDYLLNHEGDFVVMSESALDGFPMTETHDNPITSKKKVMVSGCFDWVHTGHIRFFEEASQFGDLYVVVGHDQNLRLLKGEGHPLFPQEERRYWVQSINFVKQAMISTGNGWLDAEPEVLAVKPDIFVVNHDGDRPEKRAFFKAQGIEYRVLARKPKPGLPRRVSTELRGF